MKPLGKAVKEAKYQCNLSESCPAGSLKGLQIHTTPSSRNFSNFSAIQRRIGWNISKKASKRERLRVDRKKLNVGDLFGRESSFLRNYKKKVKFDPLSLPDICEVVNITKDGRTVKVARTVDGRVFKRDPDNIKKCVAQKGKQRNVSSKEGHVQESNQKPQNESKSIEEEGKEGGDRLCVTEREGIKKDPIRSKVDKYSGEIKGRKIPRRSDREPIPNPRYFNDSMQTYGIRKR